MSDPSQTHSSPHPSPHQLESRTSTLLDITILLLTCERQNLPLSQSRSKEKENWGSLYCPSHFNIQFITDIQLEQEEKDVWSMQQFSVIPWTACVTEVWLRSPASCLGPVILLYLLQAYALTIFPIHCVQEVKISHKTRNWQHSTKTASII